MAVTGILIVVALILALQIDKVVETSNPNDLSNDAESILTDNEQLKQLEDEMALLLEKLEQLRSAKRNTASKAELSNYIRKLEQRIYQFKASQSTATLDEVSPEELEKLRKKSAEILRIKNLIEKAQQDINTARSSGATSQKDMLALEAKVKALEAQVLEARAKNRSIRLIREFSDTSKEPVIVDVSADLLKLMRFDDPKVIQIRSLAAFYQHLSEYNKQDQYFVLYFRPDGAQRFAKVRQAVRNSGFEVGYDAITQDAVLSMGKEDDQ